MRQTRVRLTPRGWGFAGGALVAAVVAYGFGWPAMLAVAGFLAGVVVAGVLITVLVPFRVHAERRLAPSVVERGRPTAVHLVLGGDAAASAEWSDDLPRGVELQGSASGHLGRFDVSAGPVEADYGLVPHRRGVLAIGPLRLERTDPLGVAVARRRAAPPSPLVVVPRIHEIVPPVGLARADADPSAAMVLGAAGDQRDIIARPYRAGDPVRQVDWRSTAHRGELMVRSEASATAQGVAVVLDTREASWAFDDHFEWALEAVASLLADAQRHRTAARLVLAADAVHDDDAAIVALATTAMVRTGDPLDALVPLARAAAAVQVVHVVTGARGAAEVGRLLPLPHGLSGVVSVVGATAAAGIEKPRAWSLHQPDPDRPVEEAWHRG